ncbi:MAG: alcohol dehydrogenase catalytic domain-containing protein [bacterium]|nr:alcohol dehydrogenase catalytic domain-containing protein [bacterium]
MPQISIIIRTFNEEKHIGNLLDAIKSQTYQDYEIILVDSGSTDQTLSLAADKCSQIIQVASRDFTFGHSLNRGCRAAKGDFFVIISAHAYPVNQTWLQTLINHFCNEKVAIVYGRHIGARGTKFSEKRDFERFFGESEEKKHPLPYFVNNANSAIRASFWKEMPYDEYLTGLEDIAWAKQVSGKGLKIVYAPQAAVHHIHEESWPQIYNRYRREAIAAKRLGIPAPPFGSPSKKVFVRNIFQDIKMTGRELSLARLKEILLFRFYQWRGAWQGWNKDALIDINKERSSLFFSGANHGVVIKDKQKAQFEETPVPEVKPGDVLIQVAYTGICTTDLEVYEGTLGYYQQGIAKYPIIPGHEFSGVIAQAGANVKDFKTGDRVVGECILSCRSCAHCHSGAHTACPARKEVGVMNYHGAYARFIVLPALYVHKIPSNLDLKTAALVEPLAVVLRGIRRLGSRLKSQSNCAVIGAGPIGNFCAQVLAKEGHRVIVFNRSEERLNFLRAIVNVSRMLDNLGQFDVIIEASGNAEALKIVLAQSRTDSTILLLGFPYAALNYNFENIVGQEKVIIGSVGGACEDFEAALNILPTLNTAPFTQKLFSLEQFNEAWNLHRSAKYLKVMFDVQGKDLS